MAAGRDGAAAVVGDRGTNTAYRSGSSRDVMREQIELLELSAHPGMYIQVMHYSSCLHIAMD